jgi:hypothetical protein
MKILCDYQNFMTCLATGIGMFGTTFFFSFLSIHLTKRYKAPKSEVGIYFGLCTGAYLLGCVINQKLLTKVPPFVQFYASFFLMGIGCLIGGPSKIFGISESKIVLGIGLCVIGFGQVAPFI